MPNVPLYFLLLQYFMPSPHYCLSSSSSLREVGAWGSLIDYTVLNDNISVKKMYFVIKVSSRETILHVSSLPVLAHPNA